MLRKIAKNKCNLLTTALLMAMIFVLFGTIFAHAASTNTKKVSKVTVTINEGNSYYPEVKCEGKGYRGVNLKWKNASMKDAGKTVKGTFKLYSKSGYHFTKSTKFILKGTAKKYSSVKTKYVSPLEISVTVNSKTTKVLDATVFESPTEVRVRWKKVKRANMYKIALTDVSTSKKLIKCNVESNYITFTKIISALKNKGVYNSVKNHTFYLEVQAVNSKKYYKSSAVSKSYLFDLYGNSYSNPNGGGNTNPDGNGSGQNPESSENEGGNPDGSSNPDSGSGLPLPSNEQSDPDTAKWQFVQKDGHTYYTNGIAYKTGLTTIDGKLYYFDRQTCQMLTNCSVWITGTLYNIDANGVCTKEN